jgi:hypothetical protein
MPALAVVVGANQATGPSFSSFMDCDVQMFYFAQFASFDIASFSDNWDTLNAGW